MTFLVFLTCYSILLYNLTSLITSSIAFYSAKHNICLTDSHGLARALTEGSHGISRVLTGSRCLHANNREHPRTPKISKPTRCIRGSPKNPALAAMPEQPTTQLPPSQSATSSQSPASRHRPAVTSLRSPASNVPGSQKGAGGRWPKALKYIYIYI